MANDDSRKVVPLIEAMNREQAQEHINRRSRKIVAEFKALPIPEQLRAVADLIERGLATRLVLQMLKHTITEIPKQGNAQ